MTKKWCITAGVALYLAMAGCSNNPFYPHAQVIVTKISSLDEKAGSGIVQTFSTTGSTATTTTSTTTPIFKVVYTYNNPVIKLENTKGLPRVIYNKAISIYTIEGKTLPPKETTLTITLLSGGTFDGTIPILDNDADVRNSVYPGDSPVKMAQGSVDVTLVGRDDNGYEIRTSFFTNLKFTSDFGNVSDVSDIIGGLK